MNDQLVSILKPFDSISLEEMDNVKLLNRVDTKYFFAPENLEAFFSSLKEHYRILEINNNRLNHYETLYFDTPDFQLFLDHHNERVNRYKLRFRKYIDSNLCYLEIKFKTPKGRTDKERKKIKDIETVLTDTSIAFITKKLHSLPQLVPALWNNFTRLTFVHKTNPERLTIDLGLEFKHHHSGKLFRLSGIVIAEVKQEKFSLESYFIQLMRKEGIRQSGFSKYCIGSLLLNKNLKYNRFKPLLLTLKKLTHGTVYPLTA